MSARGARAVAARDVTPCVPADRVAARMDDISRERSPEPSDTAEPAARAHAIRYCDVEGEAREGDVVERVADAYVSRVADGGLESRDLDPELRAERVAAGVRRMTTTRLRGVPGIRIEPVDGRGDGGAVDGAPEARAADAPGTAAGATSDEASDARSPAPSDRPLPEPTDVPTGAPTDAPADVPAGRPTGEPADEPPGARSDSAFGDDSDEALAAFADGLDQDASGDGDADLSVPELTDPAELGRVLLAVLLSSRDGVKLVRLAEVCNSTQKAVAAALEHLEQELRRSGLPLHVSCCGDVASVITVPAVFPYLRRLKSIKKAEKLSPAALETLAVVAYRQPVIRAEIEAIRGVKAGPMLRSLLEHKLVKVVGRADVPGRPLQYGTTQAFLERFGLASLADLPSLREFRSLGP